MKEKIEQKIGEIQGALLTAHHHYHSSGFIADQIKELTNMQITHKVFEEYVEQALDIRQETLDKLRLLLSRTLDSKVPYSLEEIKKISQVLPTRAFEGHTSNITYYI